MDGGVTRGQIPHVPDIGWMALTNGEGRCIGSAPRRKIGRDGIGMDVASSENGIGSVGVGGTGEGEESGWEKGMGRVDGTEVEKGRLREGR